MKALRTAHSLIARLFTVEGDHPGEDDASGSVETSPVPEPELVPDSPPNEASRPDLRPVSDSGSDPGFGEFQELLSAIGSDLQELDLDQAEGRRKDTTIAELKAMLDALTPLGEELATVEQARLAAEDRAKELEAVVASLVEELTRAASIVERNWQDLGDRGSAVTANRKASIGAHLEEQAKESDRLLKTVERLKEKLDAREAVLTREKERHAATRAKLAEQRSIAADRWRELRKLRGRKESS